MHPALLVALLSATGLTVAGGAVALTKAVDKAVSAQPKATVEHQIRLGNSEARDQRREARRDRRGQGPAESEVAGLPQAFRLRHRPEARVALKALPLATLVRLQRAR